MIDRPLFKRVFRKITGISYNLSYSQTGEDCIIDFIRQAKGMKNFSYIDIGANHPSHFNNTYLFYSKGFYGVCIEPNPAIYKILKKARPKDICLNAGIGVESASVAPFFVMNNHMLSTFSEHEARRLEAEGLGKITSILEVPLLKISEIFDGYFRNAPPSFMNVDVEGIDKEIVETIDFNKYRPSVFCIETVAYTLNATASKREDIIKLMTNNGYVPFADTYINTIFVDKNLLGK